MRLCSKQSIDYANRALIIITSEESRDYGDF